MSPEAERGTRTETRAEPCLVLYGSGQREVVKHIRYALPDGGRAIFAQALVVEAVNLERWVDSLGLVPGRLAVQVRQKQGELCLMKHHFIGWRKAGVRSRRWGRCRAREGVRGSSNAPRRKIWTPLQLEKKTENRKSFGSRGVQPVKGASCLRDLPTLVVASKQEDAARPPNFECNDCANCLHGVVASVHVVPCGREGAGSGVHALSGCVFELGVEKKSHSPRNR